MKPGQTHTRGGEESPPRETLRRVGGRPEGRGRKGLAGAGPAGTAVSPGEELWGRPWPRPPARSSVPRPQRRPVSREGNVSSSVLGSCWRLARGRDCAHAARQGAQPGPGLSSLRGRRWRGHGREVLKPTAGMERGGLGWITDTWHAGVTGPPWSASAVGLGQIKAGVLHPAGEDTDGTHYSRLRSRLGI